MRKKYYALNKGESEEEWFGSEPACCIDRRELDRLCADYSRDTGESKAELRSRWHEATSREIEMLGVYDSPKYTEG